MLTVLLLSPAAHTESLSLVHRQRYSMGTMFDVIAYHAPRAVAERAVEDALTEVQRLDDVMSGYKAESALSRLNREGRERFVSVDPALFDVIRTSVDVSRKSRGKFDVTIAPLFDAWRRAAGEGRRPTAAEIADAQRCVGSDKIEMAPPDRIRFRSSCVELDLGGIGKGYAVDRALAVLKAAGIQRALINAGGSSIAAIGAPPGRTGWPVVIGGTDRGGRTLLLRDNSMSTSQQDAAAAFGAIIDPDVGAPVESHVAVSVVAPSATISDALSTTLLIVDRDGANDVLAQFDGVSAAWISAHGRLLDGYRLARVDIRDIP